jgi:hypothetical protein
MLKGSVSEYCRHDVRGLRVVVVEDLDVPRGRLKIAVTEPVLRDERDRFAQPRARRKSEASEHLRWLVRKRVVDAEEAS